MIIKYGINFKSRLIREPLFHFAVVALSLLLLERSLGPDDGPSLDTIVVSQALTSQIRSDFAKKNQREITDQELQTAIDRHIDEDILYRHAVALGIDKVDRIVRRRLVQSVQFLLEDMVTLKAPSENELQNFVLNHEQLFPLEHIVEFDHCFLARKEDSAKLQTLAAQELDRLRAGKSCRGDDFPKNMPTKITQSALGKIIGVEAANSVLQAPVGQWADTFESVYGLHSVRVKHLQSRRKYVDNPEKVRALWTDAMRKKTVSDLLATLRSQYAIRREAVL